MAGTKYWIWLAQRKGLTVLERQQVLEHFGSPEQAYFADEGAVRLLEWLNPRAVQSLADKSLDGTDKILGDCDRLNIHVMTMQDALYPERLLAIHQPPMVLYWKGRELVADEEALIAVVGTRRCTPYGQKMAAELAMDLTRAGALVVSGMAEGIDAAAVKSALRAGGPVVSVLAGGLDVIYPWFHRELYEDVAVAGTLISEHPPGTEHRAGYFPVRNRIISGLSVGVVVVESPRTGGSLLTASHALDQDRDVFAFPGPADAVNCEGTNRLIQEGAAKLIFGARDVICEYVDRFPNRFARGRYLSGEARSQRLEGQNDPPPGKKQSARAASAPAEKTVDNLPDEEYIDWNEHKDTLTEDQRGVFLSLSDGPLTADDIVERLQIQARQVMAALTILQVQGLVTEENGRRFRQAAKLKME